MAVFIVLLDSSYSYFKKRIEGTKLTFNVGTLNYELECVDLENCEVVIPANSSEVFNVNLTSLNKIDTKYELFYEVISSDANFLNGGHIKTNDELTYLIDGNSTKNIPLVLNNSSDTPITVKLGVIPSLKSDSAELKDTQVSLNKEAYQKFYVYDYSGDYETFIAPTDGTYKLEAWGAQGGSIYGTGGFGSYSKGNIVLNKGDELFIIVGGQPTSYSVGGYNGGGAGTSNPDYDVYTSSGGGATSITNYNRGLLSEYEAYREEILIVAGGGGGGIKYRHDTVGGSAGGAQGGYLYYSNFSPDETGQSKNYGAGQIYSGLENQDQYTYDVKVIQGSFGKGAGQAGGGYYGGALYSTGNRVYSGAGGSGYIGNELTAQKYMCCYECGNSDEESTLTYSNSNYSESPVECYAKQGNGYARITYLGTNTYTLKYDSNGGSGTMVNSEVLEYETINLPKNSFTKEGYSFAGWSLSPDNDKVIYKDKAEIVSLVEVGKEITLYAVWIESPFVTYNSNNLFYGLNDVSNLTDGSITYSISNKIVTVTSAADDGFGFLTGRVYLEAGKEYVFSCNVDKEWGTNPGNDTIEVFLMLNGEYETYYHIYENNHTFVPTVSGTYWLRLDVNKKGETAIFTNISISYNISTQQVSYGNSYGDLPTPTRTGYTFIGWFDEKYKDNPLNYYADTNPDLYKGYGYDQEKLYSHYVNYGKNEGRRISQYLSTDIVNEQNDHTLYAGWKINTYTITFNPNGGSVSPTSKTVTYGLTYGDLPTPTREGYTFTGWYTSASGGTKINTLSFVTSNQVLYAGWELNRVYVYNYGDPCTSLTGGFATKGAQQALAPNLTGWSGVPTMVANSNNIQISIPNQTPSSKSSGNMCGMWHTVNKIDLTNYSKLYALVDLTFGNTSYASQEGKATYANIRVEDDGLSLLSSVVHANYTHYNTDASIYQKIIQLDISSITGAHYISFYLTRDLAYTQYPNNNMDFKIYSVWLE